MLRFIDVFTLVTPLQIIKRLELCRRQLARNEPIERVGCIRFDQLILFHLFDIDYLPRLVIIGIVVLCVICWYFCLLGGVSTFMTLVCVNRSTSHELALLLIVQLYWTLRSRSLRYRHVLCFNWVKAKLVIFGCENCWPPRFHE